MSNDSRYRKHVSKPTPTNQIMKTPNIIDELTQTSLNHVGRRNFLRKVGLATAGTAGLIGMASSAHGETPQSAGPTGTDVDVLNFALNLEYLEAEYYLRATTGQGLETAGVDVDSSDGQQGGKVFVKADSKVPFNTPAFEDYANEIASDETKHVRFIRDVLKANGAKIVARPEINLLKSFNTLGTLIGLDSFDPFANEVNFLLGAFIFEDVGVTAYKGAAPLLTNKGVLIGAAGLLSVEAYHASIVRTLLYAQGSSVRGLVKQISGVRQSLDNSKVDKDQGVVRNGAANLVPTDGDGLTFSRTTRQVLNIVYGKVGASEGLFFPKGLNGAITK